ncbi:MAG: arsenate reductase ArsC [Gammaproteobacteria bacterium]|nr:arsenate reductase ArsC [Gammaproteobacteria bacterium]MDH5215745.1 arsenate reductase ArsC [Gammaproteobacteria bacterium]
MQEMYKVLILCTGNSARSIMAEAVLNDLGRARFKAFSAGSRPAGRVNPTALRQLQRAGHEVDGLRSKSWEEFSASDAPQMNIVITVCDSAANEACPLWHGAPVIAHWGMPDPAAVTGTETDVETAFRDAYAVIQHRMKQLLRLPLEKLERPELEQRLAAIATSMPDRA